mmetsp:Transcript_24404/g.37648  ORF Transcript_24404/g.37648 Transcript_24404/m.37648 type:complete len:100 (+) Transcript_24404:374-673(+)
MRQRDKLALVTLMQLKSHCAWNNRKHADYEEGSLVHVNVMQFQASAAEPFRPVIVTVAHDLSESNLQQYYTPRRCASSSVLKYCPYHYQIQIQSAREKA